jgi:hypothetical protein
MTDQNETDTARLDGGAEDGMDERAKPVFNETGHELTDTEVNAEGETKVDLYNANHGKSARTGGPYLDDVQQEQDEIQRAKREGREPDLDNPPASVGTVLVPKSALVERDTDKSHFTDRVEVENEPVDSYVVPAPENKADPTQADWDNDSSKVAALEGAKRYEELKSERVDAGDYVKTGETEVSPAEPSQSVHSDNDNKETDKETWDV